MVNLSALHKKYPITCSLQIMCSRGYEWVDVLADEDTSGECPVWLEVMLMY
jgi:hypothetical protein